MTSPSNANTQEVESELKRLLSIHNLSSAVAIPSGLQPPNEITLKYMNKLFNDQRAKDLQKISFYAGIPVEVLEGYLNAKDEL